MMTCDDLNTVPSPFSHVSVHASFCAACTPVGAPNVTVPLYGSVAAKFVIRRTYFWPGADERVRDRRLLEVGRALLGGGDLEVARRDRPAASSSR